jgi:hypothetical protein
MATARKAAAAATANRHSSREAARAKAEQRAQLLSAYNSARQRVDGQWLRRKT